MKSTTLLEIVGTLRSARGADQFGPMALGEIVLEADDATGGPWREPAIAVGTYPPGGCRYLPADIPPGRSAHVALKSAGELRLTQGAATEPLQISIQASEALVCFAFELSRDPPAKVSLRLAGRVISLDKKPTPDGIPPGQWTWVAWLAGASAAGLALAGLVWWKRRKSPRAA